MTGSSAVTRPLAGSSWRMSLPSRTWLTGSRLDTTKMGRAPKRIWTNCLRRSSVHTLSPCSRSRASCSAAARARASVRARPVISPARDPKRLASASGGGAIGSPALSCFVHSAMRAIGRVTRPAHEQPGDAGEEQDEHAQAHGRAPPQAPLAESRGTRASRNTAAAPRLWSSRSQRHDVDEVGAASEGAELAAGRAFVRSASVISGERGARCALTSGVASITLPNSS